MSEMTTLDEGSKKILQLLYKFLKEIVNDEKVDSVLRAKVHNTIMSIETQDMLKKYEIKHEDTEGLTFSEMKCLQELIREKSKLLANQQQSTSVDLQEALTHNTKVLLETCMQTHNIFNEYATNLEEYCDVLDKLKEIHVSKAPEACVTKMQYNGTLQKMIECKTEMMSQKIKTDIFNECSVSLQAYKELAKDTVEQQKEYERKVQDLKVLKDKYKVVDCEEYQEVLNEYKKYKKAIEKLQVFKKIVE